MSFGQAYLTHLSVGIRSNWPSLANGAGIAIVTMVVEFTKEVLRTFCVYLFKLSSEKNSGRKQLPAGHDAVPQHNRRFGHIICSQL